MKTILVWYLVTAGGYAADQLVWSPPMATQAECERVQAAVISMRNQGRTQPRCIQITEVIK